MHRRLVGFSVLLLALTACSKEATTTSGGATGAPGGSSPGASAGGFTVQGSLTTSGAYDATWTWKPGNAAEPGGFGTLTLTSDKGEFANVQVDPGGRVSFGSGEVAAIGQATGTGAQVTLDSQNLAVCSFTVDTDLTGAPGGALHLKGTMTFVGSDGAITC